MSTNTINTRIQLKYDTFSNWLTSQFIPLKGEVCIAEIPRATTDTGLTPPSIGIKIGDGQKTFNQLNWIQAIAGDVYGWAKQSSIVNSQTENDLRTFISGNINDTNTQYRIIEGTGNDVNKYFLQKKDLNENSYSYVNIDSNDNPIPFLDLNTILSNITGLMRFIGVSSTAITDGGTENPTIDGTIITNKTTGDVVFYNHAEYAWTGTAWEYLGDEERYAVKGQITNDDIASNAAIAASKIDGLSAALTKLSNIAANAQVNVLEGIQAPNANGIQTDLTITNKKIQVARIAATGSIYDVIEADSAANYDSTTQTYTPVECLIFNCGDASTLIDEPPTQNNNGGD